jgi:hypothetical protein
MSRSSARVDLAALFLGLAGIASCGSPTSPPPPDVSLTLNPTTQSVSAAGQSNLTVAVTDQNVPNWTATSDSGFVSITAGGTGTASGPVTYSVAANAGNTARVAHIVVSGSTASATLEIDQAAASPSTLAFTTAPPTFLADPQTNVSANISSTVNWTAASDQSFLTITAGASGSNNGSVTYNLSANGGATRTANITATGPGGTPSAKLLVTQNGLTAAFSVSQTASVTGGDCAVKPSPSGSSLPAQIFCKFDPSISVPASLITSYKFTLVEESNETLGTGTSVSTPLTSPLTACGFGSNTATPVTIRLTISTSTTTVTVDKTVVLVKAGVC